MDRVVCKIFEGVVAYVDVRSPIGNPGLTMTERLQLHGAQVESTRSAAVTHVIFRNGDPSTRAWAEKRGLMLVTPAWLKACIDLGARVPETCYYIREKEDFDMTRDVNGFATQVPLEITGPAITAEKTYSIPCKTLTVPAVSNLAIGGFTSSLFGSELTKKPFIRRPNTPPGMKDFRTRLASRRNPTSCLTSVDHSRDSLVDVCESSVLSLVESTFPSQPLITSTQMSPQKIGDSQPDPSSRSSTLATTTNKITSPSPPRSPLSSANSPLPGWRRLPSPTRLDVALLPVDVGQVSVLASQTPAMTADVANLASIGRLSNLSRGPLTPEMLHFVVRNLSDRKHVNRSRRQSVAPLVERSRTQSVPKTAEGKQVNPIAECPKSSSRSPASVTRRRPQNHPRTSLRHRLLAKALTPADRDVIRTHFRPLENNSSTAKQSPYDPSKEEEPVASQTPPRQRRQLTNLRRPKRSIFHLELPKSPESATAASKVEERIPIAMVQSPAALGSNGRRQSMRLRTKRRQSVVIDAEISLTSCAVVITPLSKRSSLEEFLVGDGAPFQFKFSKQASDSTENPVKPREFLFTGLNSEERQVLISLLRTSRLGEKEISPVINHRLCGHHRPRAGVDTSTCLDDVSLDTWRVTDTFNRSTVTHLVSPSPFVRTVNLFKCILAKVPVVNQEWIVQSAQQNRWLPHCDFIVPGLPPPVAQTRLAKLFSGLGNIYIAPETAPPSEALKELISLGGGTITRRLLVADFVVGQYDPKKVCVTPRWILDSILRARLLPREKFAVPKP
uniref:BRCT domain-containing protein n=1 Tax=Schistocephalus solidus TaxID=70667 RepID=A0A0X3NRH7_SCHSO